MRRGTECGYREANGRCLIDQIRLAFIVVVPSGRILVSRCQGNGYGSIGRQWWSSFILGHHPQNELLLVELKSVIIRICTFSYVLTVYLQFFKQEVMGHIAQLNNNLQQ